MAKGYGISFLIALIVGVVGGLFEAVILYPKFDFVTFTLGPDILFVVVNCIHLGMARDEDVKKGARIGFINVIFVIIISFMVFLRAGGLGDMF